MSPSRSLAHVSALRRTPSAQLSGLSSPARGRSHRPASFEEVVYHAVPHYNTCMDPFLTTWQTSLNVLLADTLTAIASFVPRFLAAALLFFSGLFIARLLKRLCTKALKTVRVSALIENTPVEHFLENANLDTFDQVLGSIVYWLVMLLVLQSMVAVMGLTPLTVLLDGIIGYLPDIFAAIVVLFIGVLLAGLVESVVKGAIRSLDSGSGRILGTVASYVVMIVAVMAAITELGIASEFILILFVGFVAALSLGAGLALGLGGKTIVSQLLEDWYSRLRSE